MAKYKKIGVSEYKLYVGDLVIIAEYPENDTAEILSYKLGKKKNKVIVFNLRKSLREKLEQKVKDEKLEEYVYIDDKEDIDIEYIENKCYKLEDEIRRYHIVIDYLDKIKCENDNLSKRLKQLCEDLRINMTVTSDIIKRSKNKKHLSLKDLKDKELIDFADCIILVNGKENILAKNVYGKTGILNFSDVKGGNDNE